MQGTVEGDKAILRAFVNVSAAIQETHFRLV